ncbi:MAG: hypothetical protein LC791_05955 [Acidobacteria bacterium]|nr:hypothetical protein [Acidobacteriota bacterium]
MLRLLAICGVVVVLALVLDGGRPQVALGVVGGATLAGVSYWGIRAGVDGLLRAAGPSGGAGRRARFVALVKFFTRHVILALGAYGMIARLHLDPLGMLIGVSALALGACSVPWRRPMPRR